jgi:hypothetical protein
LRVSALGGFEALGGVDDATERRNFLDFLEELLSTPDCAAAIPHIKNTPFL